MKRGRPSTGGYSRNSKYYVKKIRTSDGSGCGSIVNFFKKATNNCSDNSTSNSSGKTLPLTNSSLFSQTLDKESNDIYSVGIPSSSSATHSENHTDLNAVSQTVAKGRNDNVYSFGVEYSNTSFAIQSAASTSSSDHPNLLSSVSQVSGIDNNSESICTASTSSSDLNNLTSSISHVTDEFDKEGNGNVYSECATSTFIHSVNIVSDVTEEISDGSEEVVKTSNVDSKVYKNISHYEKQCDWLYYSASASGFLCKTCSVIYNDKSKPWVSVGVNFGKGAHPTRTLIKHERSLRHKESVAIMQNASKKGIVEKISEGSEAARELKINFNRQVLTKYIKILYFMVKKQWAISENFESLVRFLGDNLEDEEISRYLSKCGKNATYLSSISVDNILSSISQFIEQITLTEISCSDFFTILADESTDEAQHEQLGIIVRYKIRNDHNVKEKYVGVVDLGCTNAEAITSAIEKICIAKNIDLSKCLFIALDGTNVMSGEHSGVQRRIKQHSPHCIYINCRSHRLALVFVHLLKKYDTLQSVDAVLISLWKVFHYSPKKNAIFKEIQGNVYQLHELKMIKVSVTRWLSHGRACGRVSSRFIQLIETLDTLFSETKEPELRGIREQLLSPNIILTILFLADFLEKVDILNLWLQSPDVSFSSIQMQITRLIDSLEDYCNKLEEGKYFEKSVEYLALSDECTKSSSKTRKRSKCDKGDHITKFKENFVNNFFADFKTELNNAFDVSRSEILNGFDFFTNIESVPSNDSNQKYSYNLNLLLSFYGEEKVDIFKNAIKTSAPIINKCSTKDEKDSFIKEMSYAQMTFDIEKAQKARSLLQKNEKEEAKRMMEKKMTPLELLGILERDTKNWNLHPNFMKLLTLSVIIPVSTASVERLFSRMNLVCNKLRSRMTQENLDRHLRILVNGPPALTNEQCNCIIDIFKSSGNRRLEL